MPKEKKLTEKKQKILALKKQNPDANGTEIARLAGADISYTIKVLQEYDLIKEKVDDYVGCEVQILQGMKHKIIASIVPEDIKKASLQQKITSMGIISDKIADLEGRSPRTQPMLVIIRASGADRVQVTSGQGDVVDITPEQEPSTG